MGHGTEVAAGGQAGRQVEHHLAEILARTLLVDDQPLELRAVVRALRLSGLEVTPAGGADEAIAMLPQRPTLVVVDICLPKPEDGFRVMRAAALHDSAPLVLATSAHVGSFSYGFAAVQAGASAFFEKPVTREALTRAVHGVHSDREEVRALAARLVGVVPLAEAREALEIAMLAVALNRFDGRKKPAAELLEMGRSHLQRLVKRRGL